MFIDYSAYSTILNDDQALILLYQISIGSFALTYSTGDKNTVIGHSATGELQSSFSTVAGVEAMKDMYSGDGMNTVFGALALIDNTHSENITAFGYSALRNTESTENTGFGVYALSSVDDYTLGNTGFGYYALKSMNSGTENTAVGYEAMLNSGFCDYNIAIGHNTLRVNSIGEQNIGVGREALAVNTTGDDNIAIGYYTLASNTTGDENVSIGYQASDLNTSGDYNSAIGSDALASNTTGSYNSAVGRSANSSGSGFDNSTGIGDNAYCSASDQVRIGDNIVSSIGGYTSWTNFSDRRFKKNIVDTDIGLDFILALTPVSYQLNFEAMDELLLLNYDEEIKDSKERSHALSMTHSGFIAQDVENVAHQLGYNFSGLDKPKNANDYYGLRYEEFVMPLVNAVKEQQVLIENNRLEINALKNESEQLMERLILLEKK